MNGLIVLRDFQDWPSASAASALLRPRAPVTFRDQTPPPSAAWKVARAAGRELVMSVPQELPLAERGAGRFSACQKASPSFLQLHPINAAPLPVPPPRPILLSQAGIQEAGNNLHMAQRCPALPRTPPARHCHCHRRRRRRRCCTDSRTNTRAHAQMHAGALHGNDGQRHSPLHGPGTQTVCSWWLSWLPPPSPP